MTDDTPIAPNPSSPRGRPRPLIIGLVVLALVVAGAAGAWVFGRKPADAELAPSAEAPAATVPAAQAPPALPPGAIEGKLNTVYEWSQQQAPAGVTYVIEGFTLKVFARPAEGEGNPVPAWRLTTPDGKTIEGEGVEGFRNASASFAIGRLDPRSPQPQLLFSTYTGGAHCCAQTSALVFIDGEWREVEAGYRDGEPMHEFPKDVDGDGWPEFVGIDNRFLYAFDGYAQSRAPIEIMALRGGKLVEVSTDPRYRRLYETDLVDLRKDCEDAQNSACAAYVATAARLGRTNEAWDVMLGAHDHEANWFPTACRRPGREGCAEDDKVVFDSFPDALRWFLGEAGYTPPVPLD